MDEETRERFAETDRYIAEMDQRLNTIAQQNAKLAEMVEVLGGYVNTALTVVQEHIENDHDD